MTYDKSLQNGKHAHSGSRKTKWAALAVGPGARAREGSRRRERDLTPVQMRAAWAAASGPQVPQRSPRVAGGPQHGHSRAILMPGGNRAKRTQEDFSAWVIYAKFFRKEHFKHLCSWRTECRRRV